MSYSRITATGAYLPKNIVLNKDIVAMVDTDEAWIVNRTGIEQRHMVSPNENTADMAVHAASDLFANSDIDPSSVDMVLVATCTPPKLMPSVACAVQAALGLEGVPAFDLNAACSGFLYGLTTADQFIRSGMFKHILLIGSDAMTQVVDWSDRSTCILFGDGAAAVLLSASESPGIMMNHLGADGTRQHLLESSGNIIEAIEPPFIQMDGKEVYKNAVYALAQVAKSVLALADVSTEEITWLIPHQANKRIIESSAKALDIPMCNVVLTIDRHANTSAASIPLALHEAVANGDIKQGDLLLLEAFGAGLTWAGSLVRF